MFWFEILIICLLLLSHSFPHRILFFKKKQKTNLIDITEYVGPSHTLIEKNGQNKLSFQKLRLGHSMSSSSYSKKVISFRGGIKITRNLFQKPFPG